MERLDLQATLEEILGSDQVYFQPPESIKMSYPAIVYSRAKIRNTFAQDKIYKQDNSYELILIDPDPDTQLPFSILELPYCSFDRHYTESNLNHYVFTIYY